CAPLFKGRAVFTPAARGDVGGFKRPGRGHIDYIKRLIGLPGDRVQVREGRVYIDGTPLKIGPRQPVGVQDHGYPEPGAWERETNPEGRSYLVQIHGAGAEPADNT